MIIINLTDNILEDNVINNISNTIEIDYGHNKQLSKWTKDNYNKSKKIISIEELKNIFKYSNEVEVERKIHNFLLDNNFINIDKEIKFYSFTNIYEKVNKYEPIILVTDTTEINKINYLTKFSNEFLVVNHKGEKYYV